MTESARERVALSPTTQTTSSNPSQTTFNKPVSDVAAGPARYLTQAAQAIAEFEGTTEAAAPVAPPTPQMDPAVIEVLMKNASILVQAREHRLALNLYRSVLMRLPEHPQALKGMGLALREEGRLEESLKCFRALGRLAEHKIEGLIYLAETYYLCERDDMALGHYREALKNPINNQSKLFDIYKNVGNIQVRAGDFDAAEESYNRAYVINPHSDVLMVNYGTLEIQRDSLAEAVQRFRRAVEINPENDKAWVGLALVHRQMGDLELAWANVQRALDINSKNRTALRLVIDWAVADRTLHLAITRLQDYLATEGEDAEMSFTLAKLFTHVGRLRDARIEMERVLALDPMTEGGEALRSALDRELAVQAAAVPTTSGQVAA